MAVVCEDHKEWILITHGSLVAPKLALMLGSTFCSDWLEAQVPTVPKARSVVRYSCVAYSTPVPAGEGKASIH